MDSKPELAKGGCDDDYIEVRASPKGGLGTFATRFIPAGTRIFAEPPLVVISKGHYVKDDIEIAVADLSPTSRARFMTLASAHGQSPEMWPRRIHPSVGRGERERIQDQHEARTGAQATPLSIFMTNAMSWGVHSQGAAVFERSSRINHSCIPNAHFAWNENLQMETVHAVVDVEKDEELTVTYCDPFYEKAHRKWEFKSYGFCCDCPACSEAGFEGEGQWKENFAAASAARRYRLREISELLGDTRFENQDTLAMPSNKGSLNERMMLLEGAGLMVEEKLVTPTLAQFYLDIAENCMANGDKRFALISARKGCDALIICLGSDAPRTLEADQLLERVQQWKSEKSSDGQETLELRPSWSELLYNVTPERPITPEVSMLPHDRMTVQPGDLEYHGDCLPQEPEVN